MPKSSLIADDTWRQQFTTDELLKLAATSSGISGRTLTDPPMRESMNKAKMAAIAQELRKANAEKQE